MAEFVSINGVWKPAQEYFVDANAPEGKDPVYKGPNRDALALLKEQGVDKLGKHYKNNADLIRLARSHNYNSVEEYLKAMGVDEEENTKRQQEKAGEISSANKKPKRKKATKQVGGGFDASGKGNHLEGGFDDPANVSSSQLSKRA